MWRMTAAAFVLVSAMAAPATAAEFKVDQRGLRFIPETLTVKVDDYVRFTDSDRITHNITVVNPDGTSQDKGMSTFSQHIVVQFDAPGVYRVICRIHPEMKMTVTVTK